MPQVSIVIRTHNEERHLPLLLERVREQNLKPCEIIVVDSGSTDSTLEIAEREADKVVHIAPKEFTFGRSLNCGCEVASGEALALVSAHTFPISNNWLRNLITPFDDPRVGMVYGRQLPALSTRLWERREFAELYGPHSRVLIDQPLGNNANSAIRTNLWADHPFDETLSGLEDIEWARHAQIMGYSVQYAANAAIVHIHEESPRKVYRRLHREGAAYAELFPATRPRFGSTLIKIMADTLRDLRWGRSNGARVHAMLSAPIYRTTATWAFHRGGVERERERNRTARLVLASSPPDRGVLITAPGEHGLTKLTERQAGPGDAVIRVAYVGVCATDVEIADGRQNYYSSRRADYPIVPGHEYSGVVEAVGDGVARSLIGARIVAECILGCGDCAICAAGRPTECKHRSETGVLDRDGAYASRLIVPALALHRLPDRLPLLQAAFAEPVAVGIKALRTAGPLEGRRLALVGAGPIGHITAQLAREFGADVTVVDTDEARLAPLRELDFSTATELREPERHDVIIEATGSVAVAESLTAAANGKTVILLGAPSAAGGELGTIGSDPHDWGVAIDLLARGKLVLRWLLDTISPIDEYAEAWDAVRTRSRLKTVLRVEQGLASS